MRLMALAMLLSACSDTVETMPDAAIVQPPPDADPTVFCESFGEACKSDPYPANTVCHSGDGWCIDDVCRPMCSSGTRICSGLVVRYAPAGAGYCEPR